MHSLAGFGDVAEVDVQAGKVALEFSGHGDGVQVGFLEQGEDIDGGEVEELDAGAEEEDADCDLVRGGGNGVLGGGGLEGHGALGMMGQDRMLYVIGVSV